MEKFREELLVYATYQARTWAQNNPCATAAELNARCDEFSHFWEGWDAAAAAFHAAALDRLKMQIN